MRKQDMQKRIWTILGIVFAVLLVGFGAFTFWRQRNESEQFEAKEDQYRELKDKVEDIVFSGEEEVSAEVKPPLAGRVYDFEALRKENEDIIAWLYIPNTEIDYPIFWNEDNSYYLEHNMDGSKGRPGCLYMENYNEKDFSDPVSIVYGHNMRNKTMFGTLKEFQEVSFYKEHRSIYLYTPEGDKEYKIIAVSIYSNDHLLADRFSYDSQGKMTFEGMLGNEGVRLMDKLSDYGNPYAIYGGLDDRTVTEEDHLLVLSTCDRNKLKRLLVVAKQIDD